jgi:hypothetical protein
MNIDTKYFGGMQTWLCEGTIWHSLRDTVKHHEKA